MDLRKRLQLNLNKYLIYMVPDITQNQSPNAKTSMHTNEVYMYIEYMAFLIFLIISMDEKKCHIWPLFLVLQCLQYFFFILHLVMHNYIYAASWWAGASPRKDRTRASWKFGRHSKRQWKWNRHFHAAVSYVAWLTGLCVFYYITVSYQSQNMWLPMKRIPVTEGWLMQVLSVQLIHCYDWTRSCFSQNDITQ